MTFLMNLETTYLQDYDKVNGFDKLGENTSVLYYIVRIHEWHSTKFLTVVLTIVEVNPFSCISLPDVTIV
jgi:hypothetical protein